MISGVPAAAAAAAADPCSGKNVILLNPCVSGMRVCVRAAFPRGRRTGCHMARVKIRRYFQTSALLPGLPDIYGPDIPPSYTRNYLEFWPIHQHFSQ